MDTTETERPLTRKEASRFLTDELGYPTAASTLAKLACIGGGPEYETWGNKPLYRKVSLQFWAHSRVKVRRSTSDPGSPRVAPAPVAA